MHAFVAWLFQIELWGSHFIFEKLVCLIWVWVVAVDVIDHTQQTVQTSPGFVIRRSIFCFGPHKAEVAWQVTFKIQKVFLLLLELGFLRKYTDDFFLKRVCNFPSFHLITTSQLTLIKQRPLRASIFILRFYFRCWTSRCRTLFLAIFHILIRLSLLAHKTFPQTFGMEQSLAVSTAKVFLQLVFIAAELVTLNAFIGLKLLHLSLLFVFDAKWVQTFCLLDLLAHLAQCRIY